MSKKKHRADTRNRRKFRFHRQTKPGEVPGFVKADPQAAKPKIYVIAYDENQLVEQEITDAGKISMPPNISAAIPAVELAKVATSPAISQAVADVTAPVAPL